MSWLKASYYWRRPDGGAKGIACNDISTEQFREGETLLPRTCHIVFFLRMMREAGDDSIYL